MHPHTSSPNDARNPNAMLKATPLPQIHMNQYTQPTRSTSPHIHSSQRLNNTRPLLKPRLKDAIRILEHPILQTNNNELTPLEPRLDQAPNILRVAQIQRRIHFVQDVHGRWFELQKGEDEG